MFFVLLAKLKASVSTATPWHPAAHYLRERPSTKNTSFPSPLQTTSRPPPADPKLPVIPHRVPVFQLHNGVLITESPQSHEITNVNRHITYLSRKMILTDLCWALFIQHAVSGLCALKSSKSFTLKVFNTLQMAAQLHYILNQRSYEQRWCT